MSQVQSLSAFAYDLVLPSACSAFYDHSVSTLTYVYSVLMLPNTHTHTHTGVHMLCFPDHFSVSRKGAGSSLVLTNQEQALRQGY